MSEGGDDGEDRTFARITMAIVFLMFGVPPGLCSLYFLPLVPGTLLSADTALAAKIALLVVWLLGIAVTAALGLKTLRTWIQTR